MQSGKCARCKSRALLTEDGWCLPCVNRAQKEAKAEQAEAQKRERDQELAARRPQPAAAPPREPQECAVQEAGGAAGVGHARHSAVEPAAPAPAAPAPAAPAPLAHEPELFGPAWNAALELWRGCSATARHDLLAAVLKASDPALLQRLEAHLRQQGDTSPQTAAAVLRSALKCLPLGMAAVADFMQAVVGYAVYCDELGSNLPAADRAPDALETWLLGGADRLAEQLVDLDHGPLRQLLAYLRQVEADPSAAQRRRRLALLLPLAAASAARGVKDRRSTKEARLRLLSLARWAAETGIESDEALRERVMPAVQAVEGYHNCRREARGKAPLGPATGYLTGGYFDGADLRPQLFSDWADEWAKAFDTDDVTASQLRRVFHELRRLETLTQGRPWEEVRREVFALAPLAADAAARGLKAGKELRGLEQLVRLNLDQLRGVAEPTAQRDAFLRGTIPHFEAVLARFNARRKLPRGVNVPQLSIDAVALRDSAARETAAALLNGKVSSSLLRRVHGTMRRLATVPAAGYAAERARTGTMAEEAVRRVEGKQDGQRVMLALIRQAPDSQELLRHNYVPYLDNVVRWFTGLESLP